MRLTFPGDSTLIPILLRYLRYLNALDLAPIVAKHHQDLPRGLMMGAGWVINVIVADWIIRRRNTRPSSRRATSSALAQSA